MKPAVYLISVLCVLCFAGCADTQQTLDINPLDKDGAIALASGLHYGMSEESAVAFLKRKGITKMTSGGDSFSWNDCFSLSNRCSLCLTIAPKQFSPDGAWVNGLVRKVSIYHWDGNSEPIALTNVP
ncbi:MAG TPA: hypothetical protein VGI88_10650 [Verrucomicrobiae bacterium]|jgi:hypothetical protein